MAQRIDSPRPQRGRMLFRPTDVLMRAIVAATCLIALLMLSLSLAMAQGDRGAARAACEGDYRKLCNGVMPGGGRVLKCLNDNLSSLSEPCRQALADRTAK